MVNVKTGTCQELTVVVSWRTTAASSSAENLFLPWETGAACSLLVDLNVAEDIDMLEEFAYLRTQEGGKIHLELLPNQGMLIK